MRRRTAILLFALAALVAALAAGWYFGSPWWTLRRMREAARAGDTATLASYVDWDAVRADTKARAERKIAPVLDLAPTDGDLGRALIALAGRKAADRAVDALVRPEMLRFWLAGLSLRHGGSGGAAYAPAVTHRGLSAFELHDARDPERSPILVFRRHGLGWKLEAVR